MKKIIAFVVCFAICISAGPTVIAALNFDRNRDAGSRTPVSEITAMNTNSSVTLGNKVYDTTIPTYFIDFGDRSVTESISYLNDVEQSYHEQGYTVFNATGEDPYVNFSKAPDVDSSQMKYTCFIYMTENDGINAEIYVNRSDGLKMGAGGKETYSYFSFEKTTEWSKKIIDTSRICKEGVTFLDYRFDPLADVEGGTQGKSISFKCLATFAEEDDARGFDYDTYKKYLADKKAIDEAEKEEDDANALKWGELVPVDKVALPEDTADGTLKYDVSDDGKTVTISYVINGEKVSYTVPNNINYTSGGFGGTDDLGRTLPTSRETGIYGENGEYYVGIFYFLWLGEHGDTGIWDNTKIMEKYDDATTNPDRWGPEGQMHFFAEPLYGYYYSSDEWVIRKHMELLSNANIDFLYFDVTNGYSYVSNALKVMKVCHELNEAGYDAPQVVFYTNTSAATVVRELYDNIYSKNLYPDTWLCVSGKPVIVAPESANINSFFIIRNAQWPNAAQKTDAWPWMDFTRPQRLFSDTTGIFGSAMNISVAQHSGSIRFSSSAFYGDLSNRGRTCVGDSDARSAYRITENSYKHGYNFQNQWNILLKNRENLKKQNLKYVLVTGWNEWVAQRQSSTHFSNEPIFFVDQASIEYSRDIEMTRGYYFDNYYMQLISNVQRLKGSAPVIVQDARNPINVTGSFDQWNDVIITYKDPVGDNADRNNACFGNGKYTDESGNHDIVAAKVTQDTKNMYFYVETANDIRLPDGSASWMQLFIDADRDTSTGWYGYDYIVNYAVDADKYKSTVAKCTSADGSFEFEAVGTVDFKVEGNQLMVEVPMEMLGVADYREVCVEFKWADADRGIKYQTMEDFYCYGDVAPLGRLNYIYQNYIPGVSEPVEEETEEQTTEGPQEQPTEDPTEDSAEVTEEQTTEMISEQPTEQTTEEMTEQTTEASTEQPADQTTVPLPDIPAEQTTDTDAATEKEDAGGCKSFSAIPVSAAVMLGAGFAIGRRKKKT